MQVQQNPASATLAAASFLNDLVGAHSVLSLELDGDTLVLEITSDTQLRPLRTSESGASSAKLRCDARASVGRKMVAEKIMTMR